MGHQVTAWLDNNAKQSEAKKEKRVLGEPNELVVNKGKRCYCNVLV